MGVRILRDEYLEKSDLSEEKMYQKYIKTLQKNKFDIQDTKQEEKLQNIDKFIENIPGFELRENQKKMLDTVDKTFQK